MNIKTIEDKEMECKKCGSNHLVKVGFNPNGIQKWECKDCGYRGIKSPKPVGRPQESSFNVQCVNCGSGHLVKNGFNDCGNQIWKCKDCGTRGTFLRNFHK